jgi:FkbM family methyltransferase
MQLWQVEKQLGLHSRYFSQAGQDRYLNERIFGNKRDGTFVEVGGYDGWTGSNCVFFEKVLGWTGLVVEASPQLVGRIGETRSAKVIHAAVSDREGTAEFLEVTSGLTQMGGLIDHYHAETLQRVRRDERHSEIAVTVPSTRLDTLLRAHGLQKIDYCSIDVEGAERAVLRSLDFDAFDITALSIENSRPGRESYEDIMDPAGYRQVAVLGFDEIWVRRSVLSQDPGR